MEFLDETGQHGALVALARWVFGRIPEADRIQIERVCERLAITPSCDAEFFSKGEIVVFAEKVEDFTTDAQKGILAHEFGHARTYAALGEKARIQGESLADMFAQQWGFASNVQARIAEAEKLRGRAQRCSSNGGNA